MMYNQPMLPVMSENQRNLLISLAYTISQQKLANAAKLVTLAANPRCLSDCFDIEPIVTLLHEAQAQRALIEVINTTAGNHPTYPLTVQANWIAVNDLIKALDDTSRIVDAFKSAEDPNPNTWWYNRLDIYVSPDNLLDLYTLIGSLHAIVAPFQPIDPERFIRLD